MRLAVAIAIVVLISQAALAQSVVVNTRSGPRVMQMENPCHHHYVRSLVNRRDPRTVRLYAKGAHTYERAVQLANTRDGLSIRREAGRACGGR